MSDEGVCQTIILYSSDLVILTLILSSLLLSSLPVDLVLVLVLSSFLVLFIVDLLDGALDLLL